MCVQLSLCVFVCVCVCMCIYVRMYMYVVFHIAPLHGICVCVCNAEMGDYLMKHGDAVKDIAFTVEDCRALFKVRIKVNN